MCRHTEPSTSQGRNHRGVLLTSASALLCLSALKEAPGCVLRFLAPWLLAESRKHTREFLNGLPGFHGVD